MLTMLNYRSSDWLATRASSSAVAILRRRKSSIGILARFFWEGVDRRWRLRINDLQRKRSEKTGKTQKKV